MGNKEDKTNVMRILDQKRIPYKSFAFECSGAMPGVEVAQLLGLDPAKVFKTLVTVGKSGEHYVFVIPVAAELNLKLAAAAVSEKNIEMIRSKDLLPLTGYIHGGCSPIGMKKFFTTTFDASVLQCDTVTFSGGRIGRQVQLSPEELKKAIRYQTARLCD